MLRAVILILFTLNDFGCFSQELTLDVIEPFKPVSFTERVWFIDSMQKQYSSFITFSEGSNWTTKGLVWAIAVQENKPFVVRLTSFILDTPENKMVAYPLSVSTFNEIKDSLKQLHFYQLKDESQIPPCISHKDTTVDGQKATEIKATRLTEDGLHTKIVTCSADQLRITTFYELPESSFICPERNEWKTALQVRNYLKGFFDKQSR
jgi:hypothetical protein